MALAFTPLSWWLWSGKHQEPKISKGTCLNSLSDSGLFELDTLTFPRNIASSSGRVKRKWQSREERKIDREYDIVLVPSDGGCVSGFESDDSDWSIGWLEPHGPEFHSDENRDDSFAVLVPCYGRGRANMEDNAQDKFLQGIGNFKDIHASGKSQFPEIFCFYLEIQLLLLLVSLWCDRTNYIFFVSDS